MKRLLYILLFFSLLSCSDDGLLETENGLITGPDYRLCACCGGYFIEIGNETYRFWNVPESSSLDLINADFPIYVEVGWIPQEDACIGDEIEVFYLREIFTR